MKKNYTAIFIDYFLQHCESWGNKTEAFEETIVFMNRFKGDMTESDYFMTKDILKRLTAI